MDSPEIRRLREVGLVLASNMSTRRRSHENPGFIDDFEMTEVPNVAFSHKKSISGSLQSEKSKGIIRRQIFAAFAGTS